MRNEYSTTENTSMRRVFFVQLFQRPTKGCSRWRRSVSRKDVWLVNTRTNRLLNIRLFAKVGHSLATDWRKTSLVCPNIYILLQKYANSQRDEWAVSDYLLISSTQLEGEVVGASSRTTNNYYNHNIYQEVQTKVKSIY